MNNVTIPSYKYKKAFEVLKELESGIRILGINPEYKRSLIKDINVIKSSLTLEEKHG